MARILREPNVEIRRCAIERIGWPAFITAAGCTQIGAAVADPGNPGQVLRLYQVPEQVLGAPVRVLVCTNGTVEPDGTRRTFGLVVPADVSDPLSAAAWTYGLSRQQYATLERRT